MPANRPSTARRRTAARRPAAVTPVRVRMYRQGLGDCFLLTFSAKAGPVHMLVDCGTLGATTTDVDMSAVLADIKAATDKHLHVLAVTHEHRDHVSGFNSERKAFDALQVDQVWMAWTENPADPLAQAITRYRQDLLTDLALADRALALAGAAPARSAVHDLLGFYGDPAAAAGPLPADFAKTVDAAMRYAAGKAGAPPRYLDPGECFDLPELPGFRFYVLAPPRDADALQNMGDHDSPELYGLTGAARTALRQLLDFHTSGESFAAYRAQLAGEARQQFDAGAPFDPRFRLEPNADQARPYLQGYNEPKEAWRRIEADWLASSEPLALQLDSATNNTSLVLAIERLQDGRVLLLPGDAQLGSWLSWHQHEFKAPAGGGSARPVKAADLLARTVLYKVGHHASHNATAKQGGLEAMTHPDLVALIPVDSQVALKKTPPWRMPADALYRRLLEKTRGRVLRSDTGWPEPGERPAEVPKEVWEAARAQAAVAVTPLYIEFRM